jgi:ammonium transporter, Amt family
LKAQCIGSLIVCTATFAAAMAMFTVLNKFGLLRVTKEDETEGLDISQHGNTAYPEYVTPELSPFSATPVGAPSPMAPIEAVPAK